MSIEAWGDELPDDYMTAEQAAEMGWRSPEDLSPAMNAVIDERLRVQDKEGFTPAHDDEHVRGELAMAAACYAMNAGIASQFVGDGKLTADQADDTGSRAPVVDGWPFEASWWKPKSRRENLVRAAQLIIAEIERLDRIEAKAADAVEDEIASSLGA